MSLEIDYFGANYPASGITQGGAGSYSNLAFEVLEVSVEVGRRGVLHQFPYRNEPWFEDFGRKARRYQVKAIVHGQNHIDQQSSLIERFETSKAGDLTLPTYGTISVWPISVSVINKDAELGTTEFDMTFVDAGTFTGPGGSGETASTFIDTRLTGIALANTLRNLPPEVYEQALLDDLNIQSDQVSGAFVDPESGTNVRQVLQMSKRFEETILQSLEEKSIPEVISSLETISNKPTLSSTDVPVIIHLYSILNNKILQSSNQEAGIYYTPTEYIGTRRNLTELRDQVADQTQRIFLNLSSNELNNAALNVTNAFTGLEQTMENRIGSAPFTRTFSFENSPVPLPVAISEIKSSLNLDAPNGDFVLDLSNLDHPMNVSEVEYIDSAIPTFYFYGRPLIDNF